MFASPGDRTNVAGSDLSDILPEEIEAEVKLAAEISMGTEVSEQDICNIRHLCDQVCVFFYIITLRPVDTRCLKSSSDSGDDDDSCLFLKQSMWVFSHYLI